MARDPQTGGLSLPKDVGIAESDAQAIADHWSTTSKIDARLGARGLGENPEPDVECPIVDADNLLTTDYRLLTTVYAAQLRWYNYINVITADISSHLLEVENEMEDIASAKRVSFRKFNEGKAKADRIEPAEMNDLISQDPRYRELRLLAQQYKQEHMKLDAKAKNLYRNMAVISRQIEIRKAEAMGGNREGNMQGAAGGRWERDHTRPVRGE